MSIYCLSDTLPYKGLNPYFEEDANKFFGREKFSDSIINNLMVSRLTILYGESGVGKSSLLRAGVAATLRGNTEEQAKNNIAKYGQPRFLVIVFPSIESDLNSNKNNRSWKNEPLSQLKEQIKEEIRQIYPYISPPDTTLSLAKTLQTWLELVKDEYGELFIILDQFEEYFLYHPPVAQEGTFDYEFSRAVRHRELPVNFLISIRKDFIAQLDRYQGRLLNLLSNRLELEHLDYISARKAIVKPIEEYYNQQVAPKKPIVIGGEKKEQKEEFIEEILKDLISDDDRKKLPEQEQIKASLLQLVMERLWKEEMERGSQCLKLQTFKNIGKLRGVRGDKKRPGIAAQHVDEKLDALSPREKEVIANIFHYLVTPSGSKQAISATDLGEYARQNSWVQIDDDNELKPLLEKLAGSQFRILQAIGGLGESNDSSYEIYHDVLAKPILFWRAKHVKEKEEEKAIQVAKRIRQEAEQQAKKLVEVANSRAKVAFNKAKEAQSRVNQAEDRALQANRQARQAKQSKQEAEQIIRETSQRVEAAELKIRQLKQQVKKAKQALSFILFVATLVTILAGIFTDKVVKQTLTSNDITKIREAYRASILDQFDSSDYWLPKFALAGHNLRQSKQVSHMIGLSSVYSDHKFSIMRILASMLSQKDDLLSGEDIIHSGDNKAFVSLSFSTDGKQLAAGSRDGKLYLWNIQDKPIKKTEIFPINTQQEILSVSFSPRDKQIVAGSRDGKLYLWNIQDKPSEKPEVILGSGKQAIASLSFSPDAKQLATGSADGTIRLWNLQNKSSEKPKIILGNEKQAIASLSFSSDGKQLAAGSKDGKLYLWNLQNKSIKDSEIIIDSGKQPILSLSFSPNVKQLATGSADDKIRLWKLKNEPIDKPSETININPSKRELTTLNFSPDGKYFAVVLGYPSSRKQQESTIQQQIDLWDLKSKRIVYSYPLKLNTKNNEITRISFSPDGKQFATVAENGAVKLLPIYTFDELLDKACNLLNENQQTGNFSDECKSR